MVEAKSKQTKKKPVRKPTSKKVPLIPVNTVFELWHTLQKGYELIPRFENASMINATMIRQGVLSRKASKVFIGMEPVAQIRNRKVTMLIPLRDDISQDNLESSFRKALVNIGEL